MAAGDLDRKKGVILIKSKKIHFVRLYCFNSNKKGLSGEALPEEIFETNLFAFGSKIAFQASNIILKSTRMFLKLVQLLK